MTPNPVPEDLSSSGVLADTARSTALGAEPSSAGAARRFVRTALDNWGLGDLDEDAAVCIAELATNAILHSRDQFTVAVRRTVRGARIDVLDGRPDRLPVLVPGSLDPLDLGTTGRGLMMVAALADRWGYFTTPLAKTVWVELYVADRELDPSLPVVDLADPEPPASGVTVTLIDMPVRTAIASGVQIDELVREVQLDHEHTSVGDRARFTELLELSARPRLTGRQAAFQAAADDLIHYTVTVVATSAELGALADLSSFLDQLGHDSDTAITVEPDVTAMRTWISSEVMAQQIGAAPEPYAGPIR